MDNAMGVIWNTLLVAERAVRPLDALELLPDIANDLVSVDGERQPTESMLAAA
ncbi:MAG: hypothetical protein HYY54_03080 [candidate division NC10 bacterium]|nr:hypothetical protein [candidate division NC10 bacterium]